jgi:hypothetical protein
LSYEQRLRFLKLWTDFQVVHLDVSVVHVCSSSCQHVSWDAPCYS